AGRGAEPAWTPALQLAAQPQQGHGQGDRERPPEPPPAGQAAVHVLFPLRRATWCRPTHSGTRPPGLATLRSINRYERLDWAAPASELRPAVGAMAPILLRRTVARRAEPRQRRATLRAEREVAADGGPAGPAPRQLGFPQEEVEQESEGVG